MKFLASIFFLFAATISMVSAQDEPPGNMVPNPFFEPSKKVKALGQIEAAEGWSSPTEDPADLYSVDAKGLAYAEENQYGGSEPETGEGFAGLMLYSYKDKDNRTYIQTKLKYPMNEGVLYCVKFHVSMGDLSKYACNNIGAHISKEKLNQKAILKNEVQPQIMHSQNRIFMETSAFESVCQVYEAEGGEEYLTIGSFGPTADIKWEKVKRPSGWSSPQLYCGYYFIDNVTVCPMDSIDAYQCMCEKGAKGGGKMNVVYKTNVSANAQLELEKQVKLHTVYFEEASSALTAESKAELDKLVALLTENADTRIEVKGHMDKLELAAAGAEMGDERSIKVYEYLVSKGINADRLEHQDFGTEEPASRESTMQARAKNRRVDFRLLK